MPFICGIKIGKLKIIMKKEGIIYRDLHQEMIKQCNPLGIKPVTRTELSKLGYGDKPDRRISTYIKILNSLNSLRRREEKYTLDELIEQDEVIKSIQKK